MGIGFVFVTVWCSAIANAKIDPEAVIGIWLFDEGTGKTTKDLSGNGDDVAMFSGILSEADLKTLMDEGVGKVLGVAPVEPMGKLTTMWSNLKRR